MTLILLAAACAAAFAILPCRFGDDSSAGAGPEPANDGAAPGAAAPTETGGAASAPTAEKSAQPAGPPSAIELVEQVARDKQIADSAPRRGQQRPTAATPGAPPQPDSAAPVGDTAAQPGRVFEQLGLDAASLPPETHAAVERFLSDWYTRTYTPVAERVREIADQQKSWYEQVEGFLASPAYHYGAQLADEPGLLEAFHEFLQGRGQPAGPQLPEVDEAELDETSRAIYANARHAITEAQQLRDYVSRLESRLGNFEAGQQEREQQELQRVAQQRTAASEQAVGQSLTRLQRELGFDPREYRQQFAAACRLAARELAGLRSEAEAAGTRFVPPDPYELMRDALGRAGFGAIAARRKSQAGSSMPAPTDRRSSRPVQPQRAADIVEEVAAAAGIA